MTDKEKLDIKGLISILVFVYLLMEDYFHIFNYGQADFNRETYFAKIDHDYIVVNWKIMKTKNKFPIKNNKCFNEKDLTGLIKLISC